MRVGWALAGESMKQLCFGEASMNLVYRAIQRNLTLDGGLSREHYQNDFELYSKITLLKALLYRSLQ